MVSWDQLHKVLLTGSLFSCSTLVCRKRQTCFGMFRQTFFPGQTLDAITKASELHVILTNPDILKLFWGHTHHLWGLSLLTNMDCFFRERAGGSKAGKKRGASR